MVVACWVEAHAATSATVCGSQANANTKKNTTPNIQGRPSKVERGKFGKIVFTGLQSFHTSARAVIAITWRLAPMLQGSLS
jgi:hypothetical protein